MGIGTEAYSYFCNCRLIDEGAFMSMRNHRSPGDVAVRRACLKEVDRRMGISYRTYSNAWWAAAIWNAGAVFNVWSRTQQWGIALFFAPFFQERGSSYGIAAIGGLAGAIILCCLLFALRIFIFQWGRCFEDWTGRIPAIGFITLHQGYLIPIIKSIGLVVVIGFPLAGQIHFADKFLSGTSELIADGIHANNWKSHLMKFVSPLSACRDYKYDGRDSFAYCEFYEPWAVCFFAVLSFIVAAWTVHSLLRRPKGAAR